VDCYNEGNYLPVGVSRLICFGIVTTGWASAVTALTSVAALFTIIFGSVVQVLVWSLQLVHSRSAIRWLVLLCWMSAVASLVVLWARVETVFLSVIIPQLVLLSLWGTVRIRGLQLEMRETGRVSDSLADWWVESVGLCTCWCRRVEEEDDEEQDQAKAAV
jgi:hypothetical protein